MPKEKSEIRHVTMFDPCGSFESVTIRLPAFPIKCDMMPSSQYKVRNRIDGDTDIVVGIYRNAEIKSATEEVLLKIYLSNDFILKRYVGIADAFGMIGEDGLTKEKPFYYNYNGQLYCYIPEFFSPLEEVLGTGKRSRRKKVPAEKVLFHLLKVFSEKVYGLSVPDLYTKWGFKDWDGIQTKFQLSPTYLLPDEGLQYSAYGTVADSVLRLSEASNVPRAFIKYKFVTEFLRPYLAIQIFEGDVTPLANYYWAWGRASQAIVDDGPHLVPVTDPDGTRHLEIRIPLCADKQQKNYNYIFIELMRDTVGAFRSENNGLPIIQHLYHDLYTHAKSRPVWTPPDVPIRVIMPEA